ncbi:DUF2971 domain-containing protein, partial [Salmonella enterica]
CRTDSFLSIIKNKKLWLSSMDHLNDFMEKRLFISEFEKFINESEDPKVYQSIRRSIEANMNLGTPYLCCLSGSGDILSQWRSYGQDGYGLSIGFDPDKLVAHKGTKIMNNGLMEYSIFLNKVEYLDTKSIYDLIATLMHEYRGVVKFHNGNLDFDNQPPDFQNKIVDLDRQFFHFNTHIKSDAFKEENEIRLVYVHNKDHDSGANNRPINNLTYRISNNNLTSYFEFVIPHDAINKIYLGPKNKFSENDVRSFLKHSGIGNYQDVEILKSIATYC